MYYLKKLLYFSIIFSIKATSFQKEVVCSDQYCKEVSIRAYADNSPAALVGIIDYGINLQSGFASIATLYVDPQFRNQGTASKLIQMALEDIKHQSSITTQVTLQALPQSPDMPIEQLISFYTKRGAYFESMGECNGIIFAKMKFELP